MDDWGKDFYIKHWDIVLVIFSKMIVFCLLLYWSFHLDSDFLEAEDFEPLPAKVELKSNWDDEDVDENDIKDSWEEEDEPAPVWFLFQHRLVCVIRFLRLQLSK